MCIRDSTITGSGGTTNTPCWFSAAPSAEAVGIYLSVSFSVLDSAEGLEVLGAADESSDEDFFIGTFNYGTGLGVDIKLSRPLEDYRDSPSVELTAGGTHYVSGPRFVERLRTIEGFFYLSDYPAGVTTINDQYEIDVQAAITPGTYRPVSPPSFSSSRAVVGGVETVKMNVNFQQIFAL